MADDRMKRLWLLLLAFICAGTNAQDEKTSLINNLRLEVKGHCGVVYPHHSFIRYLVNSNVSGFELSLTTDSYGKSYWDELYRYPRYGVGYLMSSLGNREVFGNSHTLFLNLEIPLVPKERRLWASYQFCLGVAYLDQIFDLQSNPVNIPISTHLNLYGSLRFNANFLLTDHSEISMGLNLGHYSNGKTGITNYGLNAIALQLGFKSEIQKKRYTVRTLTNKNVADRHSLGFQLNGGWKTDYQYQGDHYPVVSFVGEYLNHFKPKFYGGIGLDLFYDGSLGPDKAAKFELDAVPADNFRAGCHASVMARYNKIYLLFHAGYYLYYHYAPYSKMYGRLGIHYDINSRVFLSFTVKAHSTVADFFEWGVGYRLPLKDEAL
ncbi:MAG: acyloxyacyl hydrolase [Bacteroidales bacterium]|nr:acyloxyacyl hydrolase [Bacteroidales bacterium]